MHYDANPFNFAPSVSREPSVTAVKMFSAVRSHVSNDETSNNIPSKRRTVRLLSRRYALTPTGYKYLEIGINVGPPSYIEIAIGDHRGQELILSLETWKGLYALRQNIMKLLQSNGEDTYNYINVGPLTVRVSTVGDVKLARLECLNVRLTMTEPTLRYMLDLDQCVDVAFDRLVKIIDMIDINYTRFANIASTVKNPEEAANAIRASDIFDKSQLIDCELVALVFNV